MATCPDCEAVLTSAHAACPNCGAELRERTRRCEGCAEEIAADADTCPACGTLREPVACETHPEREAAGRCVICGRAVCDECNEGGATPFLCRDHSDIPVIEGWASVYSTSTDVTAELIRENLVAEGVDARVLSGKDHFSLPVNLGDLSPVRVVVPAFAYEQASEVIRSHMDESGEVGFACPACGEAYEPGAERCDSCGAALR